MTHSQSTRAHRVPGTPVVRLHTWTSGWRLLMIGIIVTLGYATGAVLTGLAGTYDTYQMIVRTVAFTGGGVTLMLMILKRLKKQN